jgi:hypothetical protein
MHHRHVQCHVYIATHYRSHCNTDHYKVAIASYRQIRYVGGVLGLAFSALDKMKDVPSEVAAAWLLRQDNVTTVSGEPTWRSLVNSGRKDRKELPEILKKNSVL